MLVTVRLHSIFRGLLPSEARGSTQLELPEGSRVRDVMTALGLPGQVVCSVNEQLERSPDRILHEGDLVRFFRPSGGGSC